MCEGVGGAASKAELQAEQNQTQKSATAFSTGALQAYLTVNADTSPFKLLFAAFAGFVAIHLGVVVAVVGMAVAIASCKYRDVS